MSIYSRIIKKMSFMLSTKHRLAEVMTFKDYLSSHDSYGEYHLTESGRKTMVMPVQFVGEVKVHPSECSLPDTYYATLSGAKVIGASSVVISKDGKMLYDMLAECDKYNANMTDNGLCLLGGRPRHFAKRYIYNYLKDEVIEIPTAISLLGNMSNNYYHFMLQVAAKFYPLNNLNIPADVPLLLDETVLAIPQMKEVIEALNVNNRFLIPVKKNQLCKVNTLYCISEPNVIVPNSKTIDGSLTDNFAFDPKSISYLRETISSKYPVDPNFHTPKRVFLSRKNCNKRRCNEEVLEPVLKEFGFELVQTEEYNISQQIQLFSNAEHIMGSSGAAFTNMIYCNPSTKATVFFPIKSNITCFSSLGSAIGISIYHILPKCTSADAHKKHFSIPPEVLYSHLTKNK